jgi:hypothetical protein
VVAPLVLPRCTRFDAVLRVKAAPAHCKAFASLSETLIEIQERFSRVRWVIDAALASYARRRSMSSQFRRSFAIDQRLTPFSLRVC